MPADAPESGGGQATASKASPDVFISYASQDKALADSVCEALERAGVVCWIAPRDVAPGEFYADAIVGAINTTRVVVLLLTENVVGSPHVLREIERASAKRHPVVTFRVESTTLPAGLEYFLSASHWLDATASGVDAALPKLGKAVRRLLAPVAAVEPRHHADTAKPPAEPFPQRPMGKPSNQRLNRAIVATVALIAMVVGYLFVDKLWFSKHAANERPIAAVTPAAIPPATPISDKSVAVMPFLDMSEKKDQEYFSDGMSEELIDKLARIPELRVPARTSSFYFKGKQATVSEIAKALSVAHVLEGSVRKSGNTLRVTTQLIRVDNGYHVWSETYDRQLTDVFKVQDEIAGAVVKALKVSILHEEALRAAQTTNPEAYETYLRANYYFDNFDLTSDLQKSIDYYRQAIKLDPNYAPTYAHMAQAYAFLAFFGEVSPSEGWGKAKEASSLAVQKDERLPEGHGALALAKLHFDWDFPGAEQEFKRALELNPNDADVRHDYAHYLMAIGRLTDSEAESRRAVELDPVGEGLTSCLCWHSFAIRDYDQSVRLAEKFLRSHPDDPWERTVLGWTYEQKRMPEQAIAQFKRAVKLTKGAPFFVAALGHAYAVAGNRREAEETLQTLSDRATKSYVSPFDLALIHAALGEKDKAFALLDKAVSERSTFLVYSKWEPRLDPLRSDARFQDLLRQIGLGN